MHGDDSRIRPIRHHFWIMRRREYKKADKDYEKCICNSAIGCLRSSTVILKISKLCQKSVEVARDLSYVNAPFEKNTKAYIYRCVRLRIVMREILYVNTISAVVSN